MLALVLSAGLVQGQITITKEAGDKMQVNWKGFKADGDAAAQTFYKTLQNNLRNSGWFSQTYVGEGEISIGGSCRPRGRQLRVECHVHDVITQRPYLNRAFTGESAEARRLAHQVSDAIVEAVTGHRGMASARLVMVGTKTGKKELYIADADGRSVRQITKDGTVSVAPKWGANNQIVYTSYLKRYPDVYLIDVNSGRRTLVSNYAGLNTGAALSPDGSDMALILSKDGNPELYVRNMRSGKLTRITRTPDAAEASPTWSPDGSQIAYVSDQSGQPQIYTIPRGGGRAQRLTSGGTENVAPDWGPAGLIAYSSRTGGRYQIAVIDPKSRQRKLLETDGADYEDPSWAPDGRHLACTRTQNYRAQVYLLDTMGDSPVALTDYSGDWYSPSWSP
jgi:TolB protein